MHKFCEFVPDALHVPTGRFVTRPTLKYYTNMVNTRSSRKRNIPGTRSLCNRYHKSHLHQGHLLWNNFTIDMQRLPDINWFKRRLKKHLLDTKKPLYIAWAQSDPHSLKSDSIHVYRWITQSYCINIRVTCPPPSQIPTTLVILSHLSSLITFHPARPVRSFATKFGFKSLFHLILYR